MNTINISLPSQLKLQAEELVDGGFYASFSDLVRTSLRKLLAELKYDVWAREAEKDYREGRAIVMKNSKDIAAYIGSKTK